MGIQGTPKFRKLTTEYTETWGHCRRGTGNEKTGTSTAPAHPGPQASGDGFGSLTTKYTKNTKTTQRLESPTRNVKRKT